MKTERLRELLGAFEAAKGNKPNTRMQVAFVVMKALPALLSRLESAERVVEAALAMTTVAVPSNQRWDRLRKALATHTQEKARE